jgi:hypothetical protein
LHSALGREKTMKSTRSQPGYELAEF